MLSMKMRGRIALVFVAACALVIIALVTLAVTEQSRASKLLDQWRSAGGAESGAALKPQPISDDENAATLYRQAHEQYINLEEHSRHAIADFELNDESRAALDQLEEAIELIVLGSRRLDCLWDWQVYDCAHLPLHEIIQGSDPSIIRNLASIVFLAAQRAADDGDLQRSIDLLQAARNLAEHAMQEPTTLSLLQTHALNVHFLMAFQSIFKDRPLPNNIDFNDVFDSEVDRSALHRAVLVEGTCSLELIRFAQDESLISRFFPREERIHLAVMLRLLDQVDTPHSQRDLSFLRTESIPSGAKLSRLFLPGLKAIFTSPVEEVTRVYAGLAQTAVALRRYRDEHGEYPTLWKMPADHVTGNAMHYERTETGGFILRSDAIFNGEPIVWEWE